MKPYLLCTDLDRTLIPNGSQPASPTAMALFAQLVKRDDITLAYVSGRSLSLIQEAIAQYDLPQPDFAIADVGTTIYQLEQSRWQQWPAWDAEIARDWRGLGSTDILPLLASIAALTLQEKAQQNRHKLSFYVPIEVPVENTILNINNILDSNSINSNVIWSIDEAAACGLLDVLPAGANKLHAIKFLIKQKGYTVARTIFAGDSGNDLDVLLSDIPSVLVANAHADVKSQARNSNKDALYIAHGDYLGLNGNYSAGILEGVAHYWPEMGNWLQDKTKRTQRI
jgi:sucrose-6F-phosphate phosphohydrolase